METALCNLDVGQEAIVTKVNAKDDILRRLLDIGIVQGTKIKSVIKAPTGDPTAYLIRGAIIALRKEDAKGILVNSDTSISEVSDNGTYFTGGGN